MVLSVLKNVCCTGEPVRRSLGIYEREALRRSKANGRWLGYPKRRSFGGWTLKKGFCGLWGNPR